MKFKPLHTRPAAVLPARPVNVAAYDLTFDRARSQIVVVLAPGHHQVGHAWTFDGATFSPWSSTTIRLGSQAQQWRTHFDVQRQSVVAWSFDGAVPVGCIVDGSEVRALAPAGHTLYGDPRTCIALSGEVTEQEGTTWPKLKGIFAVDEASGVTLCLTRHALFELRDTTWTRAFDIDASTLPAKVNGDSMYGGGNGTGAVWDPVHQQVVFWFHDHEGHVARFFAATGRGLVELPREGLPTTMWERFGETGFAVCAHATHGVVVLVAGTLYARTADGFGALPRADGAPPTCKHARMVHDPVRGLLLVGPYTTNFGEQNAWHVFDEAQGQWRMIGISVVPLPFNAVTTFLEHDGATYAVDVGLHTWVRRAERWVEIVDTKTSRALRERWAATDSTTRAQCVMVAFGSIHAVMDDGRVAMFDGTQWVERTPSNEKMELHFPAACFDGHRIVLWGSGKKSGKCKNEAWFFDGSTWKKSKKQPEVPECSDVLLAVHHGQVMRLTDTSLSVLEGDLFRVLSTWTTPLVQRKQDALVSAGDALQLLQWSDGIVWSVPLDGVPVKTDTIDLERARSWWVWREHGDWRVCDEKDAGAVYVVD
jgi:hypothetical protein